MMVDAHEVKPGSLIVLTNPDREAAVTVEAVADEIMAAVPHSDFVILWVTDGASVTVDPSVSLIRKLNAAVVKLSEVAVTPLDLTFDERALLDEIENRS